MTKYKSLFIDLDDTLWDTVRNNKDSLEELYAAYRLDSHYDSFESFYAAYKPNHAKVWAQYRNGEIDRQTLILERFRPLLAPAGITERNDILAVNQFFLERTGHKNKTVPGARELVEYLRPRYKMYILSNGFREIQYKKLENAGLAPYFDRLILSEDACIQKPHPGIFDYALVNTNSRRAESLMIGDSWEADIIGARNSHIDQLWFNPGGEKAREFTPTYTVSSLEEIKKIL